MKTRILLATIIILALGTILYVGFLHPAGTSSPEEEGRACTMEAKICPDGTAVGRQPPSCAFAPCPVNTENLPWKTATDTEFGITFAYPEDLLTEFIHTESWPPEIEVASGAFSCIEGGGTGAGEPRTVRRMVQDRPYCVTTLTEGAAGSVYSAYTYRSEKEGNVISLTFTLRMPQCANYGDPEKDRCEGERESFDLDGMVDRITQTVKEIR
jgi:hypothetical protein